MILLKYLFSFLRSSIKSVPFLHRIILNIHRRSRFADLYLHELMLSDKVKMDSYKSAIDKYIKKGDTVIDAGAGTGILSFLALSKDPGIIYAVEESDIIQKANYIAKCNKFERIVFKKKNSRHLKISEKADIIIHDLIGTYLFNENMLSSIIDLRNRLLKKDGMILPGKFILFVEPVKLKDKFAVPMIWEYEKFKYNKLINFKNQSRKYLRLDPYVVDYLLSDPEEALYIDLEKIDNTDSLKKIKSCRRISKDGRFDGYCFYFKVIFDDDIFFSNSPLAEPTHWKPVLLRCESEECKKGDKFELIMHLNNITDPSSWNWEYKFSHNPETI